MFIQVDLGNMENKEETMGFLKGMGVEDVGIGSAVIGNSTKSYVRDFDVLGYVGEKELLTFKAQLENASLHVRSLTIHDWEWVDKVAEKRIGRKEVENLCHTLNSMGEAKVKTLIMPCSRKLLSSLSVKEKEEFEKRIIEVYREISRVAEQSGVKIVTHMSFIPDTMVHDYKSLDSFLEGVDSKANSLLLCIGSISLAAYNVEDFIERYYKKVCAVHIKNVIGDWNQNLKYYGEHHEFNEIRFDAGQVNIPSAISKLAICGYEGCLIPEHFPLIVEDYRIALGWAVGYLRGICDSIQQT